MTTAKIQRLDEALLGSLLSRPSGGECSATYIVDVVARAKLHAIAATRLTGEERLVTLLVEMALFLGFSAPGGRVFEQPLSRQDMADYLGLNPDTLSRLMTRLRSLDLISLPTRSRMIVRDLARLSELSPLADALRRLHGATVRPAGA